MRQLCLVGLLAACAGRQKAADDLIPVAKSIAIYSAGGSVVSGVIDPAAHRRAQVAACPRRSPRSTSRRAIRA